MTENSMSEKISSWNIIAIKSKCYFTHTFSKPPISPGSPLGSEVVRLRNAHFKPT